MDVASNQDIDALCDQAFGDLNASPTHQAFDVFNTSPVKKTQISNLEMQQALQHSLHNNFVHQL